MPARRNPLFSSLHFLGKVLFIAALLCAPLTVTAEESIPLVIQQRLEELCFEEQPEKSVKEPIYAAGYLLDLYRKNQFQLLWTSPDNISQLQGAIIAGAEEGLIPDDYHLKAITHLGNELKGTPSQAMLVEYDLLLSDAMIMLDQHKRYGKVDPRKVEEKKNLEPATPRSLPTDTYLTAIRTGTVRATLERSSPEHQAYINLKQALTQYRKIASNGGWPKVPAGPSLKPGMQDQRVAAMRKRLAVTGDYHAKSSGDPTVFDDALVKAVKAFQTRHHLEPDGVGGQTTINAMNVPVADRINQIRVNLERTRLVIRDMPSSSLIIDIAGFMLQYYHQEKLVWSSKVMVGKPFHQTPVFRSAVTYLVLNPTWTIPPEIAKNETVPSISKDLGFLNKQRLRVLASGGTEVDAATIPWNQYVGKHFPYTLRQDSGADNSLGLIKFLFPNPYHVYLHDTPSKSLFGRTQRAFSHGCIRVQNPLELGKLLLANDLGNTTNEEKFAQILASGKTATVILKQPLPIFLIYLTTNVRDGLVLFKPDLYDRDPGVFEALNGSPSLLEQTPQIPEAKVQTANILAEKTAKAVAAAAESRTTQTEQHAKNTL
jgi:murein L,D-transpeptidase YcbB/YkuD